MNKLDKLDDIVQAVMARLDTQKTAPAALCDIPAEVSARHVHLSAEDLKALFHLEQLESLREISQPGQFLSSCRVRLIGPKGVLDQVAVLGPLRKQTQVEISQADARLLGIQAPLRLSGDLQDAAMIHIQAGENIICRKAAIIAKRHLHMTPQDAQRLSVSHGQKVLVRVMGSRTIMLEDVLVRVSDASALALHIDTDEANAAGLSKAGICHILDLATPHMPSNAQACTAASPQPSHAPVSLTEHLITEEHVKRLKQQGARSLKRLPGQLITPLARDTLKAYDIILEE